MVQDSRVTLVTQAQLELLALLVNLVIRDLLVIQDRKVSLVLLEAQETLELAARQERLVPLDLTVLLVPQERLDQRGFLGQWERLGRRVILVALGSLEHQGRQVM